MDGVDLISHLGHGVFGTVFLAQYEGELVALKLQYDTFSSGDPTLLEYRTMREYGILEGLRDIQGVPSPITKLPFCGTYDTLGLAAAGKPLDDITVRSEFGHFFFGGAFIFDYIPNAIDIYDSPSCITPNFLQQLECLFGSVHSAGYTLSCDTDIVSSNANPFLIDVANMGNVSEENLQLDRNRLTLICSYLSA